MKINFFVKRPKFELFLHPPKDMKSYIFGVKKMHSDFNISANSQNFSEQAFTVCNQALKNSEFPMTMASKRCKTLL